MSKEYYIKEITEILNSINSEKFLRFLLTMIRSFRREWGI